VCAPAGARRRRPQRTLHARQRTPGAGVSRACGPAVERTLESRAGDRVSAVAKLGHVSFLPEIYLFIYRGTYYIHLRSGDVAAGGK